MLTCASAEPPDLTAQQLAELPQYFGFAPFQIYKFQPGIELLHLADLDGDDRTDILFWNGRKSRLELLYQPRPDVDQPAARTLERNEVPDRGNLRSETVPLTYKVAALDVADLTGDHRPDIVFFGEPKEVVILPGQAGGGFGPGIPLRAPEGTPSRGCLCTGDFNGDGRIDVALRGDEILLVFHQKSDGGLGKPVRLVHGIKNSTLMLKADVNGDGRDDLVIGADAEPYGLYVCMQGPDGALSAFQPVRVPRLRSLNVAPPTGQAKGDDLYMIELATGRLKHYRWEMPPDSKARTDWPQQLHSYPLKSASKQRPLGFGDVDGDGYVDCVALDPDAAQVVLFRGGARGLGAGTLFPGLSKASDVCVADLDGDGRAEVLLASPAEKMLGRTKFEDGRLSFPTPLRARGEPCVLAVGALEVGAPAAKLAYVTREERVYKLVITGGETDSAEDVVEIGSLDDEPSGLRFVDLNQDGRQDLLLFVRFAAPRALLQDSAGKFAIFSGPDTHDWLLKEARPEGFALADITGDGRQELLLAQDNLARALTIRDGRWTVVDQYNPEQSDARLRGLTVLPEDGGRPTLVMYEQKAGELLVFRPRSDGAYAVAQTVPVGSFDPTAMDTLPVAEQRIPSILLADASRLAVITPGGQAPTLVEQHSYETDVKEAWLGDSVVGDLNHDGVRDVAVLDWGKAAIEILTTPPAGGFVRALRFQVFQGKRFRDTPDALGEPREFLIGDVTGDSVDDIVLIVHDRLIVYPGQ